jgi:hypothetical protein
MNDPTLAQAVGYAQWNLLRNATVEQVEALLQTGRDYQWLTAEERKAVIAAAQRGVALTQWVWQKYPHLRAELTDLKHRRKRTKRGSNTTRPNR